MNKQFISYRRDIVSYISYPKDKLLKLNIVDNKLIFDKDYSYQGRIFYILKDKDTIDKFHSSPKFRKYQNLENFELVIEEINKYVE